MLYLAVATVNIFQKLNETFNTVIPKPSLMGWTGNVFLPCDPHIMHAPNYYKPARKHKTSANKPVR